MDARHFQTALLAWGTAAAWLLSGGVAAAQGFEMEGDPTLTEAQPPPAQEAEPPQAGAPSEARRGNWRVTPALLIDGAMGVPEQRLIDPGMPTPAPAEAVESDEPLLKLGVGDQVNLQVFGRPEFNTTTYVADDGSINVPLVGAVEVAGKSPSAAANAVARALKGGEFLVNPQVSIVLPAFKSQQVSVLGDVRNPGRYPLESRTTVLDLLAQAGGIAETGSTVIYLLRAGPDGKPLRQPVDLRGLASGSGEVPDVRIRSGDSVYVPRAEQFYVYGEVQNPNAYRLDPDTTVLQAITRGGGLTPRGSDSRIVIKRRVKNGKYQTFDADLTDTVHADDVIRVKERIF
ncbi:MAG TPA: SLBB domain-containing protein [Roseateles sp.]|uniref:SLBB domain-containing protein n=1 Tax=Roseateles sp. TaxID=1971397 RepID=UPI002ED7B173